MNSTCHTFSRSIECGGMTLEISCMTSADRAALFDFVATLPTHDLLFLRIYP
jgi:hypothetical protein